MFTSIENNDIIIKMPQKPKIDKDARRQYPDKPSSAPYLNSSLISVIHIIVIVLLSILFIQVILSINQNSVTIDEFAHLPAGYSYLKTGDFRLNTGAPPFIKMLAALPLLFMDVKVPYGDYWNTSNFWGFGYDFMQNNFNSYQNIFDVSRIVVGLISVLLGYFVYRWGKELYGETSGLFALFLYCFCPNILAHSGLVTVDLGVSCFMFIALFFFWKFSKMRTTKYLIVSGVTLGLAQLSKFSALVLVPIYMIITMVIIRNPNILHYRDSNNSDNNKKKSITRLIISVLLIFIISLFIINLGYGFKGSFKALGKYNFQGKPLSAFNNKIFNWIPSPLPYDYMKAFDEQSINRDSKRPVFYLCGKMSDSGWWYYYIVAFSIKVPIPLLLFISFSFVLLVTQKKDIFDTNTFVLAPLLIMAFSISFLSINFGIRYILPIFPFVFLFVSRIAKLDLFRRKKIAGILISVLLVWYLGESISIYPHYLAYFNELAGGPDNGYKYLIDSNIDWGQDLIGLKKYMDKKEVKQIYLAYFGRVDPAVYGISYKILPDKPVKGDIAISASYLQGRPYYLLVGNRYYWLPTYFYSWLRGYKPVKKIGYSIFVYKL